ncbi:MAG: STAS domain-containing protein [Chloroflexia bacterium]
MSQTLATWLAFHREALVAELAQQVRRRIGGSYGALSLDQLKVRFAGLLDGLQRAAAEETLEPWEGFIRAFAAQQVAECVPATEGMDALSVVRELLLEQLRRSLEDPGQREAAADRLEDWLYRAQGWFFEAYLEDYENRLTQQQRALAELSTPVIQIHENILVVPLVGAIDTERARRIMEELLLGITRYQAEIVIIDITGVPVVDTAVANHLMQTVKAARLLGTRSILVGISSEVAQALVHLQIDLSGVVTRSNLQAGIEYALEQMGLEIAPIRREVAEEETAAPERPLQRV